MVTSRLVLSSASFFLELNGFIFMATEEDATQAIFGLAGGTLDNAAYTAWLRANSKPGRKR
jgi:prophage maintenance system killer protein